MAHQHSQHSKQISSMPLLFEELALLPESFFPSSGVWWRASSLPVSLCGNSNCSAGDTQALQGVARTARIIGSSLPSVIYNSRCRKRASCIIRNSAQPASSTHNCLLFFFLQILQFTEHFLLLLLLFHI